MALLELVFGPSLRALCERCPERHFIDDMLLGLYYIYEKSPKKCKELEKVIEDLQQFIQFEDSGTKPIRASGSRWVSHKLSAMKHILSKYGAHSSHLIALSEDSSVKSVDRTKLRGYSKWSKAKYILGCAFFVISPCAIFSKILQDSLDILGAFTSLRTIQELAKLSSKSLQQWPNYSATLKNITQNNGSNVYQQHILRKLHEAERYYQAHFDEYCTSVTTYLKSRLEWTDILSAVKAWVS